ncbi:MAG: response regulator [Microscillaceae bacterium]|nr:response regulator [Microscillaceae bacterium]
MKKVRSIMLIDDNEIDNLIHARFLKDMVPEVEVSIFQSSAQALAFLISTAAQNPEILPDLILLDLHMPMMDGFTFMKAYQEANLSQVKKLISSVFLVPFLTRKYRIYWPTMK